ncbi:MAG: type II toxin-antitoxin system VapC family toxin [Propionicimonas sp.]
MIIADTNIVSEFMKDEPDAQVLSWARALAARDLTICVVTVEEIERGLGRLPKGRRRKDLERRWAKLLDAFADSIATYDVAAARATARLLVEALGQGRPVPLADAQIAGICLSRGAQLATRNVKDFAQISELTVVNPFDSSPS